MGPVDGRRIGGRRAQRVQRAAVTPGDPGGTGGICDSDGDSGGAGAALVRGALRRHPIGRGAADCVAICAGRRRGSARTLAVAPGVDGRRAVSHARAARRPAPEESSHATMRSNPSTEADEPVVRPPAHRRRACDGEAAARALILSAPCTGVAPSVRASTAVPLTGRRAAAGSRSGGAGPAHGPACEAARVCAPSAAAPSWALPGGTHR